MGLPVRVCDLCGGVDDHPRHVIAGAAAGAYTPDESVRGVVEANITSLVAAGTVDVATALRLGRDYDDTTSQDRHIDCCAAAGCPTGTCGPQVEGAAGKTGAALRKHILSGRAE